MRLIKSIILIGLVVAHFTATHDQAFALSKNWKDCSSNELDRRIHGCSRIIKAGRDTRKNLAIAYVNRGTAYKDKGDYDLAIADYTQAIKLNPKDLHAYLNRGFAYGKKGDYDQAIVDLTQALKLNPKDADAFYNRGFAYQKKRQYDQAIADYTQAIKLNPKFASANFNRSLVYEILENYQLALEDVRSAIKIDPKNEIYKMAELRYANNIKSSDVDIIGKEEVAKANKNNAIKRTGKRLALLIGIDSYSNLEVYQQLKKAKNDARSLADAFGGLGFQVTLETDLGRSDINRTLDKFANQIEPGDEVVFFFAGHGVSIRGRNFLLPSDVPDMSNASADYLTTEAIPADRITDSFKSKGARVALLILDACRNNPFKDNLGRSIGGKRGLARMDPPEGTFVLFSAGNGQTALDRLSDDDPHPNSVFTRTLIPLLKKDDLEIARMARLVRREVKKLAATINHIQTPAAYNEMTGDFYLATK